MEYVKGLREKTGNMPLILTGAAGAVFHNGELLLVLHREKNLWQIPGGLQEINETLENTVKREIKEELGLTLEVKALIALLSDPKWGWKYPNGFQIHPVTAFFHMEGEIDMNKIRIQESEILDYSFFRLDRIPGNTFPCCKEKIRILSEYISS
jgi:ADP-ribose pyrophosphatase YjhB (NUDIX family)